jgi:hypothetical protein
MTPRFVPNACGRTRHGVAPLSQITDQFDHASLLVDRTQIVPAKRAAMKIAQYPAFRARVHSITRTG